MRLKPTIFTILLAGCGLITAAFLWVSQSIEEHNTDQLQRELRDQAALLISLLDPSSPDIDHLVDKIARHVPYRITVIAEDGMVVGDSDFSGQQLAELENHANRPEILDAKQAGRGDRTRYSPSLKSWMMYSAVRARASSGYIRVAASAPPHRILAPPLRLPLAFLLLAAITAALIANHRITKAISEPKKKLEDAIQAMSEGDFNRGPGVHSSEELGSTARALGNLAVSLERRTERLESEGENLKTVLSSMSEGVLITDTGGRIIRINPAFIEIFNLQRDPIGRTALEIVRDPVIEGGVSAILGNRQLSHHEVEIKVDERVLLARFARLERDTAVLGVVIVFHDITRLRRLENVRKEFISNLSHEFRTPLTSIRGFSETVLDDDCNSPIHRNFLPKIHKNAQQLSQMIDELLKLASLEARGERLEKQMVSFHSLVSELREEFRGRLAAKGIELTSQSEPGTEFIPGHEAYLRTIFHNLLDNAVKYTNGGTINIAVKRSKGDLIVAVSDTGIGIPAEDLNRVFERFYRVDKDRSRESGGSGIGLALVKHLVQVQGGRVWAESTLGRGSTFYFSLPANSCSERVPK